MKKLTITSPFIVIEWNGQSIDGRVCHNIAELEELAQELGRLVARRDLAAARAHEEGRSQCSDEMVGNISIRLS